MTFEIIDRLEGSLMPKRSPRDFRCKVGASASPEAARALIRQR
jgi:hypothetical protein